MSESLKTPGYLESGVEDFEKELTRKIKVIFSEFGYNVDKVDVISGTTVRFMFENNVGSNTFTLPVGLFDKMRSLFDFLSMNLEIAHGSIIVTFDGCYFE